MKRPPEPQPQVVIRCYKGIPVELLHFIPCNAHGRPLLDGRSS